VIAVIARRDYQLARSYRLSFLFDLFFGFISLLIYFYISRAFGDAPETRLGGAPSYFSFAAVGVSLTIVFQAATVGLTRRLREEQLTGTLEALAAEPVRANEMALGLAGFPFLFAILRAALYIGLAWVFLGLDLSDADFAGFAAVLLTASVVLTAVGIALGALVLVFKRGDTLAVLASFALTFGGGAYFPVSVLPDILQPLAEVLPTTFIFDGMRAALFRGEGWVDDAAMLVAFGAVGVPLAIWAFALALAACKRRGTLTQY